MCACSGRKARAGRAIMTSGDHAAQGMTGAEHRGTPACEPLAVVIDAGDGVESVPEGAKYRLVLGGSVAYFGDHGCAFSYQAEHPGKLRKV